MAMILSCSATYAHKLPIYYSLTPRTFYCAASKGHAETLDVFYSNPTLRALVKAISMLYSSHIVLLFVDVSLHCSRLMMVKDYFQPFSALLVKGLRCSHRFSTLSLQMFF